MITLLLLILPMATPQALTDIIDISKVSSHSTISDIVVFTVKFTIDFPAGMLTFLVPPIKSSPAMYVPT